MALYIKWENQEGSKLAKRGPNISTKTHAIAKHTTKEDNNARGNPTMALEIKMGTTILHAYNIKVLLSILPMALHVLKSILSSPSPLL